ncbi:hypothetical protein BLJAPNOD_04869 [Ensifer sp. M14]|uniref:putative Ig domain-containing protein n=1 Tax=Ensifer sp. M14 TaxID=2203782 RepID=UPI000E1E1998|nr:putative Ig domain-containing protein [Ensifer sp. M14]RDL48592.1 hypothetical protein BLJAPNOD_04869 [Ensifer sp. M14]
MTSYRSATAARSCNRAVRVASGGDTAAMQSDGIVERKCIATPVVAGPKDGKIRRFWHYQIRLLTALVFLLFGLLAAAGEAFASKGCEDIVADLNGKEVGFFTGTYPKTDFETTDQLHIDLIRNPTYLDYGYFSAVAQIGAQYMSVENQAGTVTGDESASISGKDLVQGGLFVETINYSPTTYPWRMDVVCVTKSNPLDAALSGLDLSSGNLEPAFNTNTMIYTATVANGVSTLGVTPSTAATTTAVKINGVSAVSGASNAVPLDVGENTLTITVMTEDRTVKRTYWVVVTRAAPATITGVAPSIGSTAGGQSVTITGTNFIGVSAVAFGGTPATTFTVDSATRITAIAPARTSGPVDVTVTTVGNSSVTRANGYTYVAAPVVTAVKPLDTPARTYAIGATLLFDVEFDQHIASNGGPYLKAVFGAVERRINLIGAVFNTMTFSYTVAENDLDEDGIAISSMARGGATITDYNRLVDADITLRNIADTSGIRIDGVRPTVTSVNPAATAATFDVTFSEPVTAVDIGKFTLAKTGTAQGTIDSVSGSGSTYQVQIANVSGEGTLALGLSASTGIKDFAGNEMTKAYTGGTPMIVAPPSSDASLSGIGLSYGTLAPAFDAATTSYTVSVGNSVSTIAVTPASTHSGAVVSVNGTVVTAPGSLPVNLQVGDNAVSIVVTAQDAVTKTTYDIVVTRAGAAPDAPTAVSAVPGDGEATVSFTAPMNAGTTPISSYTVTSDPGGAVATGGSSPITVKGLANGTVYTFTVTATNSIGPGPASDASSSVTPKPAPIANAVSVTVAANSTANPVTLSLSGGAADTLAIGTQPMHGTASVSGLAITYTPTPGYSGSDSFDYTATNATGTSAAATVTITVTAPTLSVSPVAGALPGGTAKTAYSGVTVAASAGTSPYIYAVTGTLPDGLTLDPASGLISGTPTTAGDYTFTVTATDANNATGTAAYSIAIAVQAPTAGNVSATVGANSTANPLTLDLGGGIADALAIGTQPTHGTASVSGLAITYTPTPGYSGSDSFTYTATNATGTSTAATVTITVTAPTLSFSPVDGALPGGTAKTAYSGVTVAASAGTAPYIYAVTGTLPDGLTLDPASGLISGTPTTAGDYTFTVTATDANNATGTAAYSIAIAVEAPTAGNVSATVAANSTANPVTLDLGGGIADTLAIGTQPTHGTAAVSGLAITYTPTPGYSGSDSFTYTATNATGTSTAATVTITVTAPTLSFSPAAGTLTGGIVGTAYDVTVAASAGTAPYRYAVASGALPAGLALDGTTGRISGTPTTTGSHNFTVTATDANTATGTASYSIAIVIQAPTANNVRATVAANSAANPITLDLSGGAADSVAIGTQPAHGTAAVSGLAITYTPTPGYSGTDSFTYVATNTTGTSPAATVAITVTAPTLTFSPPAGALASGTAGAAYSGATVTASAGTAPYRYAVTSGQLPAGLALDSATGAIAGIPTRAGNHDFTVTATDANNAAGTARYSITIEPAPVNFTFEPPAGTLKDTMAGEDYSQPIAAKGGTGPMLYRLASGALPKGMVINVSTGELTGALAADAAGSYTFAIEVRDSNGATGTASYTLNVQARTITVSDKVVDVPAGSAPPDVYLNRGATGGPFTAAEATFVEPAQAGTASIIQGELAQVGPVAPPVGWYLKFTPNKAYSGQVRIGFRLVSALGASNTGTVTYNLAFDASSHAAEIDALVRDFVRTRQNLIASTIKVPGLLDRRQMAAGTDTVTTRMTPSTDGVTLGFSTSLAQMEAARDRADGVDQAETSPFNIWLDSTFLMHRRKDDDDKWGNFGMVSLGTDYLLSEKALLGLSFHYDRMTDPTDEDAELSGNGWLAGPYASFELGKGIFWDTSLLYGGSSNTIDTTAFDGTFDTRRLLLDTAVKGQWQLDDATVFTPALRAVYFSETVDDYGVKNGAGDIVDLKGFTEEQLRVSLRAEIARQFSLENDMTLTPKLAGTVGYSGLDGAGLFGSLSAALSLQTAQSWSIDTGLLFNIEGDGETSAGAKVGISGRF